MNTEHTPNSVIKESLTADNTTFDLEWAKRGGVVKVLETPFLAKLLDASGDWATYHTVGSYNNSNFKFSASIYPNHIDGWLYAVERMATRAECEAAGVEYIEQPSDVEALRKRIEELDASESQLIRERDIAEKAIDDVMNIVFGAHAQEWSSEYAFGDAVEDVATEFNSLEARIKDLEDGIQHFLDTGAKNITTKGSALYELRKLIGIEV